MIMQPIRLTPHAGGLVRSPTAAPRPPALALADAARLRRYREYLEFYEGRHFSATRRGRSALVANYARAIVDKGVSFLIGRGIGFAVGEREGGQDGGRLEAARAAEALLYSVYDDNDLDAVDLACAVNAAVLGDGVYKVCWDTASARLRVVSVDPLGFFARWASDDLATLQQVELSYTIAADDAAARYGVSAPATPPGWGGSAAGPGVSVVETWTVSAFHLAVGGVEVQAGPNPYGVIPFVHVPNLPGPNEFWGRSDLVDVIPLNRELNERMSDQADVIRYHADPPVVFRGVEAHDSPTVGPGTVWDLPRDADVKLLEWQGQPVAVQEHLNLVLRVLYETAETPRTAFGDSGRLLSGVALETELRPLIQRTLRKRIVWSAALRRRARLIWRIAEQMGLLAPGTSAGLQPRIIWPGMMPADDAREVHNQVALVAAGLRSHRTAMDLLGTETPETELERVRADRAALGLP
jgi:hypothetical protein